MDYLIKQLMNKLMSKPINMINLCKLRYRQSKKSSKTCTSSWLEVGRCLDTFRYGVIGAQPGTSITVSMVLTLVGTWVFCCFTSTYIINIAFIYNSLFCYQQMEFILKTLNPLIYINLDQNNLNVHKV